MSSKLRRAASLQDKALTTEIFRKCPQLANGLATPDARLESSCTWCMGRKRIPKKSFRCQFPSVCERRKMLAILCPVLTCMVRCNR